MRLVTLSATMTQRKVSTVLAKRFPTDLHLVQVRTNLPGPATTALRPAS
jgi:hypothetical protein